MQRNKPVGAHKLEAVEHKIGGYSSSGKREVNLLLSDYWYIKLTLTRPSMFAIVTCMLTQRSTMSLRYTYRGQTLVAISVCSI